MGLRHRRALPDDGPDPSGASGIDDDEPGDLSCFPEGHGPSIQRIGDRPCHSIPSFDNGGFPEPGKFEEIDLDAWVRASPNDLLSNTFAGASPETIAKMKQG